MDYSCEGNSNRRLLKRRRVRGKVGSPVVDRLVLLSDRRLLIQLLQRPVVNPVEHRVQNGNDE